MTKIGKLTLEGSNNIDSDPPAHFRKLANIWPFYADCGQRSRRINGVIWN